MAAGLPALCWGLCDLTRFGFAEHVTHGAVACRPFAARDGPAQRAPGLADLTYFGMAARTPRVLILVENLSVPFDRRVWRQCQALRNAAYEVTVICPAGLGRDRQWREEIDGVSIYRYPAYDASSGIFSYFAEYFVALFFLTLLTLYVAVRRGFDVIQICNPPDLLILIAAWYRVLGKRVIFDQHDL